MALRQGFCPSNSVFPCQYHSTIAPYSFIHLPPTLYNVSLPVLQFSPVSIIPPLLHTHSFIYHPRCIMFLSQYFSFPCQYHSTIAPYSFFHLSTSSIFLANGSVVKQHTSWALGQVAFTIGLDQTAKTVAFPPPFIHPLAQSVCYLHYRVYCSNSCSSPNPMDEFVPVLFPGLKRAGRGVDHPPHLGLRLKKEYSSTYSPPLGFLYLLQCELHLSLLNL